MKARTTEEYIRNVVDRLPRAWSGRGRIGADLRLHLAELVEETSSEGKAVERMGPPERVAAELLAQIPLVPTSLARRFAAFLIDMIVMVVPFLPLFSLAAHWQNVHGDGISPERPIALAAAILLGLAAIAYFPVLEALFGQTIGKRLVGTCVVRDDGSRVGWGAAILRRLPFFMNLFALDAVFVFFTRRRQRAFDKVAGTVVIGCR
jgi:uncharacterized RDD family membrane protein YckC